MDNILDITDLRVRYSDGDDALRGISFGIAPAQRVAIIGPNGAGKTSLLLSIMRGVSYTGRVVIDGIELSRRSADDARGRCGMMFQDADDQLFMPTLLDDVAFGPLNQGLDADAARARAVQAIRVVGLSGLEMRSAHHLSGGQKRCAALATILSMQVKLLLLDELGANLDHRSKRRLVDLLAARPEAMLLATHDLDLVRELCQRVIILDDGRIVADAATADAMADGPLLEKHGLA